LLTSDLRVDVAYIGMARYFLGALQDAADRGDHCRGGPERVCGKKPHDVV